MAGIMNGTLQDLRYELRQLPRVLISPSSLWSSSRWESAPTLLLH